MRTAGKALRSEEVRSRCVLEEGGEEEEGAGDTEEDKEESKRHGHRPGPCSRFCRTAGWWPEPY